MSKSRNKNKKRQSVKKVDTEPKQIRLSQCMIVKNEEKNIERALSWAKDIAFEQIVVDTGSTDRTVEIAEKMGAKVFHFEWIDDFSAAKNYAIEQASGNWIAFLDADEYLQGDHPERLMRLLKSLEETPEGRRKLVIETNWMQLNDSGEVFAIYEQRRFFRNRPDIRYENRIHEWLVINTEEVLLITNEIDIYHTGYTNKAFEETKKAERNEKILREELKNDPESLLLKGYLADALTIDDANEEKIAEARELYKEIVYSNQPLNDTTARNSFDKMLRYTLLDNPEDADTIIDLCCRAISYVPDVPDYRYYLGKAYYAKGEFEKAYSEYEGCEKVIEDSVLSKNRISTSHMTDMFADMTKLAVKLSKWDDVLKYSGLTLVIDKYQEEILAALIGFMKVVQTAGLSNDREALEYLRRFYDFNDPHDKLFLAKCAKRAGDEILMIYFYQSITAADKAILNGFPFESNVMQ